MGSSWLATMWDTSEMTDASVYTPFTFDNNVLLRAVRPFILFEGDPTFTSLNMLIYSDDNGVPGEVIHTSTDVRLKAEIVEVEDHGFKETYFTFDDVPLRGGTKYHFVINAVGYTASLPTPTASLLGWIIDWPANIYGSDETIGQSNVGRWHYQCAFITAEF